MSGNSNMGDGHGQNISMSKFGFIYEERVQYWKISVKYDRIVYKVAGIELVLKKFDIFENISARRGYN